MRNYGGNDEPKYRCLANLNDICNPPSNTVYPPQSVPMIFEMNVTSAQVEVSSTNLGGSLDDLSASQVVPGATPLTNGYQVFNEVAIDPNTCAQVPANTGTAHQVYASYVTQVEFGGNFGTRDAVVIDEEQGGFYNGIFYPGHIERFYYVLNIGRVRDSSANFSYTDPNTGINYYSNRAGGSSNRHNIMPSNLTAPGIFCPQGSAPFN